MEVVEKHETVLLKEAVEALNLSAHSVVVDATGGAGGHSAQILSMLQSQGTLIVFESDQHMIAKLRARLGTPAAKLEVLEKNFRTIEASVRALGIEKVDAVLADLGWNSEQFFEEGKGFSFQKDEPLLMTYGDPHTAPFTASDIINTWSEEALADALYAYADERYARRIARTIVEDRKSAPIVTTSQLVASVMRAVPALYRRGRIHPATKTFQALRIAVNDEFDALREFIEGSLSVLSPQGRLAIITFHSIEDRIVKEMYREAAHAGRGTILTKKPIVPSATEVQKNSRARSAHLRIFQTS